MCPKVWGGPYDRMAKCGRETLTKRRKGNAPARRAPSSTPPAKRICWPRKNRVAPSPPPKLRPGGSSPRRVARPEKKKERPTSNGEEGALTASSTRARSCQASGKKREKGRERRVQVGGRRPPRKKKNKKRRSNKRPPRRSWRGAWKGKKGGKKRKTRLPARGSSACRARHDKATQPPPHPPPQPCNKTKKKKRVNPGSLFAYVRPQAHVWFYKTAFSSAIAGAGPRSPLPITLMALARAAAERA